MTRNPLIWNVTDYKGEVPQPTNWEEHPEWFGSDFNARKIPGPRVHPKDSDVRWYWGPTEWIREIGEYTLMCYRTDKSSFQSWRDQTDHGTLCYVAWVDDRQVDMHWESLDELLVDMVRFKYEGQRGSSGPRATEYFMRMIQNQEA